MADLLTITDVARRSGVASSALRFYEERGLISSLRSGSGHRRYPRAVLRRIAFIVFAQKIGLSLDEIGAELSRLPDNRVPAASDWAKLSAGWSRRVDERIAELQRLRAGLTQCIGCGCLSLQHCQLANPADRVGRAGPGARLWVGEDKSAASRRGVRGNASK
jgi:MerR family transcriptional regulator, redox-sensitive transcriptional activator SoxR